MNTHNTPRLPIPELRYEHKDRLLRKEHPLVASRRIWIITASAVASVMVFWGAGLMFFGATAADSSAIPHETIIAVVEPSSTVDHTPNPAPSTITDIEITIPQASLIQSSTSQVAPKRIQTAAVVLSKVAINIVDSTNVEIARREVLSTINPQLEPVNIDIQDKTAIRVRATNAYAQSRQRMQQITFLDGLKRSITADFNDFIEQVSASNLFQKQE